MSEGDRLAESRSACRRVLQALPAEPVTICVYAAMKSEVDLSLLLPTLFERGCAVFFPCFEDGKMVFRRAESASELRKTPLGFVQPPASAPLLDPAALQYAIVPARAYTKDGKRMGRGNGGYDIWIRAQRSANPGTKFWGIAFEAQILPDVPMEAHDERVDAVFTARGSANEPK